MTSVHVSTRNVVPDISKTQKRVAVTSGIWISLFWKLSELEKACSVSSRKGGAIPQNLKRLFFFSFLCHWRRSTSFSVSPLSFSGALPGLSCASPLSSDDVVVLLLIGEGGEPPTENVLAVMCSATGVPGAYRLTSEVLLTTAPHSRGIAILIGDRTIMKGMADCGTLLLCRSWIRAKVQPLNGCSKLGELLGWSLLR